MKDEDSVSCLFKGHASACADLMIFIREHDVVSPGKISEQHV